MANKDLFKPSISLWQHYVTIITVGGSALAYSLGSGRIGLVVAVTFFVGAAVEGCIDARQSGEHP